MKQLEQEKKIEQILKNIEGHDRIPLRLEALKLRYLKRDIEHENAMEKLDEIEKEIDEEEEDDETPDADIGTLLGQANI